MEIGEHKVVLNANRSANDLNKYRFSISISCFIAFIGTFICCIEQEIYLKKKNSDNERFWLLIANLIVSLLLVINITFEYYLWIRYKIQCGEYLVGANLRNTNLLQIYALEIFVNIVCPYPWLYKSTFTEHLNGEAMPIYVNTELFTLMIVFKSYHFARYCLCNTDYVSPRSARV